MEKLNKQFESLFTNMPCELRETKALECTDIFKSNLEKFTEWQRKMLCYSVSNENGVAWKFGGLPDITYTTEEILTQFLK